MGFELAKMTSYVRCAEQRQRHVGRSRVRVPVRVWGGFLVQIEVCKECGAGATGRTGTAGLGGGARGSVAPSPPTPLPRFTGARGDCGESAGAGASRSAGFPARDLPRATGCLQITVAGRRFAVCLFHAKPRRRKGKGTRGRGEWCDLLSGSAFHFLQSAFYGMDAIPPSPPTPLPRFTGARGEFGDSGFFWPAVGGLAEARRGHGTRSVGARGVLHCLAGSSLQI